MRFRKLPVVIDAIQYNGANHEELGLFAGDAVWLERGILFVRTLENRRLEADCGDWIIKGIKGEFYPCKPDIFAATYEPIEDHDAPRLPLAPGLVAREIARMLEEQREACVLAICSWCREALAGEAPSVEQKSGQWVHVYGEYDWWTCAANAIRSQR